MKAQASLEFLIMFSFVILLFSLILGIYFMNLETADKIKSSLEAKKICYGVSSTLNSFSALGENSTYIFDLPYALNSEEYEIWIFGENRLVKINYLEQGIGCPLHFSNIQNGAGESDFEMEKNSTVFNYGGSIIVQ
ncbi:MAG: hypothetical protein PHU63_02175 [Candidatus ainarchaeum sp.]|nr:hypothetical protein [Candidatus ainarchaeum sp.]